MQADQTSTSSTCVSEAFGSFVENSAVSNVFQMCKGFLRVLAMGLGAPE